jgi:hypothetical protein
MGERRTLFQVATKLDQVKHFFKSILYFLSCPLLMSLSQGNNQKNVNKDKEAPIIERCEDGTSFSLSATFRLLLVRCIQTHFQGSYGLRVCLKTKWIDGTIRTCEGIYGFELAMISTTKNYFILICAFIILVSYRKSVLRERG